MERVSIAKTDEQRGCILLSVDAIREDEGGVELRVCNEESILLLHVRPFSSPSQSVLRPFCHMKVVT